MDVNVWSNKVLLDIPESGNLMYLPLQEIMKQRSPGQATKDSGAKRQQDSGESQRVEEVRQQFEQRLEDIRRGRSNQ